MDWSNGRDERVCGGILLLLLLSVGEVFLFVILFFEASGIFASFIIVEHVETIIIDQMGKWSRQGATTLTRDKSDILKATNHIYNYILGILGGGSGPCRGQVLVANPFTLRSGVSWASSICEEAAVIREQTRDDGCE